MSLNLSSGPFLKTGREGFSCGLIQDSVDGEIEMVVVSGGYDNSRETVIKSTEIWTVGSSDWIEGIVP